MNKFTGMIQTNELRIGDFFWDSEWRIQTVYTIHETVVNESWTGPFPDGNYKLNEGYSEDDMTPIPLTPEWLERCGFEAFNNEGIYARKFHAQGELILFSTDSPVAKSNDFPPGKIYYMFSSVAHFIDHLHQLQNLYFALTGEELTIKEPA